MKTVIGIVGEKGSGKETVGDLFMKIFPEKKIVRVRSSDILAETLTAWGLPLNRSNLQNMAIVMDKGFGLGTLSAAVRRRIDALQADIVIFDGVRWETDVKLIRSFEKNFLIYVTAKPEIRYERIKKRKEKVGEGSISYEQFMKEEMVDTETQIPTLGKGADIVVNNDGDLSQLQSTLVDFPVLFK